MTYILGFIKIRFVKTNKIIFLYLKFLKILAMKLKTIRPCGMVTDVETPVSVTSSIRKPKPPGLFLIPKITSYEYQKSKPRGVKIQKASV